MIVLEGALNGMVESLRVLEACRKTAVNDRWIALQMIQNTIIAAPNGLRDQLRGMMNRAGLPGGSNS